MIDCLPLGGFLSPPFFGLVYCVLLVAAAILGNSIAGTLEIILVRWTHGAATLLSFTQRIQDNGIKVMWPFFPPTGFFPPVLFVFFVNQSDS